MSWRTGPAVRVLVTGFGPFPGMPQNASASMVGALSRSPTVPGIELFTEVVPVVWAEARAVTREAIARVRPHAILHFGVSKRLTGFEIETCAVNIGSPRQDHAGVVRPAKPLDRLGKPLLHSTLPPPALLRALRQSGFPVQLSRNAGRYLCNALFYWSLADSAADGALVSFVHMPALGAEAVAQPQLTLEDATAGAHVLIRASAQAVLLARPSCNGIRGGSKSDGSQTIHGAKRDGRRAFWRKRR